MISYKIPIGGIKETMTRHLISSQSFNTRTFILSIDTNCGQIIQVQEDKDFKQHRLSKVVIENVGTYEPFGNYNCQNCIKKYIRNLIKFHALAQENFKKKVVNINNEIDLLQNKLIDSYKLAEIKNKWNTEDGKK